MKIKLEGTVRSVTPVTLITGSQSQTRKQSLILVVEGYKDDFGEKKGKDETWEIQLFNDSIAKHKLIERNLVDKKVKVVAFLNSRHYTQGEEKFILNLVLSDVREDK